MRVKDTDLGADSLGSSVRSIFLKLFDLGQMT